LQSELWGHPAKQHQPKLPLRVNRGRFDGQSTASDFMDEYGSWIYLTPIVLGGAATMLAAVARSRC